MQIILQTPRLILRRFTNSDADAALILQLNSDPLVLKYLHEPVLDNINQARRILTNIILPQYENKLGRWAIHLKGNNQFIGWCGLKHRPEINEIDLGYRLMQSAWGKGYATEASDASLQYAFEILRLKVITGRALIENLSSIAVLKKIGMKYIKDEMIEGSPVKTFVALNPGISSQ